MIQQFFFTLIKIDKIIMRCISATIFFFLICLGIRAQELIPYLDGLQYGYADISGHVVVTPQFDDGLFFDSDGVANVRKGSKWSLINQEGKILFPFDAKYPLQLGKVYNTHTTYLLSYTHGGEVLNDLRMLVVSMDTFILLNRKTWKVSPIFNRDLAFRSRYSGIGPETAVTFNWSVFVGRISDTAYQVIDKNLNCIFSSSSQPIIKNDSLLTIGYDDQSLIYNYKSHQQTIIPFPNIEDIIKGKYCIVSDQMDPKPQGRISNIRRKAMLTDIKGNSLYSRTYDNLAYKLGSLLIATSNDTFYLLDFQGVRKGRETYKALYFEAKYYYAAQLFNNKWILLDSLGRRALPSNYNHIGYSENGQFFSATVNQQTFLFDSTLKVIVSHNASYIYKTSSPDLFVFGLADKEGLLNSQGKVVIEPKYDQSYPTYQSKFIQISNQGKKGLLRLDGSIFIEPSYDEINENENDGYSLYFCKQGDFYSCFDERGNLLADSLSSTFSRAYKGLSWIYMDSLFYFYNSSGKLIYDSIKNFSTEIVSRDSTLLMVLWTNTKSYLLNAEGNSIIPDGMQQVSGDFQSNPQIGLFTVSSSDKEGVINHHSKWIIPLHKQTIQFVTPFLIGLKRGSKTYLYRSDGTVIHHLPYDSVECAVETPLYSAKRHNNIGFIDAYSGKELIPVEYDHGLLMSGLHVIMTKGTENGNKMTFLFDTLGQLLLKTSYDDLYPLESEDPKSYYQAYKNSLKAIIDMRGNILIPFDSIRLQGFADSTFFTRIDKDCNAFLLNRKMDVLYSVPDFPKEFITLPHRNYLFKFNGHSVIVDHEGHVLKKIESDEIEIFWLNYIQTNFLKVNWNGMYYFLNMDTLVEYKS